MQNLKNANVEKLGDAAPATEKIAYKNEVVMKICLRPNLEANSITKMLPTKIPAKNSMERASICSSLLYHVDLRMA